MPPICGTVGATPVLADVETATAEELADQLRGHDAVVWSAGAGGGNPERTYAVDRDAAIRSMDAAAAAGVQRYVMVSYLGAGKDHGVPEDNSFFPYAEAKAAADEYLKSTSLDWTILGPGALTLEPATGKIGRTGHAKRSGEPGGRRDGRRGGSGRSVHHRQGDRIHQRKHTDRPGRPRRVRRAVTRARTRQTADLG